jgi:hypothetical protein
MNFNSNREVCGWSCTVDLRVLTSLEQLLLKMQTCFFFSTKHDTLMRRSTVVSLPL